MLNRSFSRLAVLAVAGALIIGALTQCSIWEATPPVACIPPKDRCAP